MGSFILESIRMKVLIAGLLCATVALALPEGRRLRAEEQWRPAQGRDLSKYQPRQAMVPATAENLAWAIKEVKKTGASPKKGTNVDLAATCGIEGPAAAGRIVGGHDAWFCGGSLISENYVLTAAHCAEGASYFDIMAGAHNVRESSEPHRVEITSYNGWTHPQWDRNTLSNDVALIELPSPIEFNDYISPSCMPMAGDTADEDELVTCTGWGKPSDNAGGISPVLRTVEDRPIISNSDCNAIYGIVGSGVVCIDTTGGKGTCNGDSGGPLNMKSEVTKAGQKWKQVGIVSFGASAGCEVGYPAGFSRVEYYLDWISSETGMEF